MQKDSFEALAEYIEDNEISFRCLLKVVCATMQREMEKLNSIDTTYKDNISGNGYVFDIEIIGAKWDVKQGDTDS